MNANRSKKTTITLGLILALALATPAGAEVRKIELDVAGYLCGL